LPAPAPKPRWPWLGIAAAFVVAAGVHVVALVRTDAHDGSPPWRHALFAAIDLAVAAGVARRPRAFWVAFAALTLQQLHSHGGEALRSWRDAERVDWASIVVVVGMPIVLAMLIRDARARSPKQT
jgi:hypothetical protein